MPNWTQEWFKYNFWKISSAKMLLIDTSSSSWALWFVVTSRQLRFAAKRRVFRIMEKEWFHLRVLFDDFDPTKLMNDDSWSKKIFGNALESLEIFRCFDPFSFQIFHDSECRRLQGRSNLQNFSEQVGLIRQPLVIILFVCYGKVMIHQNPSPFDVNHRSQWAS